MPPCFSSMYNIEEIFNKEYGMDDVALHLFMYVTLMMIRYDERMPIEFEDNRIIIPTNEETSLEIARNMETLTQAFRKHIKEAEEKKENEQILN